jgi:hypothetical protein
MTSSSTKPKINGYFIIVGLLLLGFRFFQPAETTSQSDLNTKVITLAQNSHYSTGRRHGTAYELSANEAKATFVIDVAGGMAAKWGPLKSLLRGDTLQVQYRSEEEGALNNHSKWITVYALQKQGRVYYGLADYYAASIRFERRLTLLACFAGGLLVLNGLSVINSKTIYILAGIGLVILVLLRIFDNG